MYSRDEEEERKARFSRAAKNVRQTYIPLSLVEADVARKETKKEEEKTSIRLLRRDTCHCVHLLQRKLLCRFSSDKQNA